MSACQVSQKFSTDVRDKQHATAAVAEDLSKTTQVSHQAANLLSWNLKPCFYSILLPTHAICCPHTSPCCSHTSHTTHCPGCSCVCRVQQQQQRQLHAEHTSSLCQVQSGPAAPAAARPGLEQHPGGPEALLPAGQGGHAAVLPGRRRRRAVQAGQRGVSHQAAVSARPRYRLCCCNRFHLHVLCCCNHFHLHVLCCCNHFHLHVLCCCNHFHLHVRCCCNHFHLHVLVECCVCRQPRHLPQECWSFPPDLALRFRTASNESFIATCSKLVNYSCCIVCL